MSLTIGVDVGGTKIAAAAVDQDGTMIDESRIETPEDSVEKVERAIVLAIRELASRHKVEAVGIGAAGFIADRSTVVFAPNLPWRDHPLGANVKKQIGLPVVVENDANAAAWGEFRFGAAAADSSMLLLTVGTGVGGGVVMDGQLQRGAFGAGGEVGHIRMVPDGVVCGCGQSGCLEVYASGTALVREARRRVRLREDGCERLLETAKGDPEAVEGPAVTDLALDGDAFCVDLFRWLGSWLGQGAATLSAVLDPAAIVIGGGVSAAGRVLLDPTWSSFCSHLTAGVHRKIPELRIAQLGNEAGIVGAADLARQRS